MTGDVVYQPRCPFCGAERYVLAAVAASNGEEPCHSCGKTAPIYRDEETYRAALRQAHQRWACHD